MTTAKSKDNLIGICNAVAEDFGFNPLWLRLALGAAFIVQPVGVIIGYLGLGLAVLVSRLAFPNKRTKQAIVVTDAAVDPEAVPANEAAQPVLARAA